MTAIALKQLALSFALTVPLLGAAQSNFTDAEAAGVEAFLRDNFPHTNACMVIGWVDQRGARIFSAGKLDNGTDREPDGDTVFFMCARQGALTSWLKSNAGPARGTASRTARVSIARWNLKEAAGKALV